MALAGMQQFPDDLMRCLMAPATMSYAQLLEAYRSLQEHMSALAGAAVVQRQAPHTPRTSDTEMQAALQEHAAQMERALKELQSTEEELRQQHEQLLVTILEVERERARYALLFALAPDAYLVTDTAGIIREANHAAGALLGMAPEHLVGKPLSIYVATTDRQAFLTQRARLLTQERTQDWETQLQPRHGPPVPVSMSVAMHRSTSEQASTLHWLLRDDTARKQAKATLRELNVSLERHVQERTALLALIQDVTRAANETTSSTAALQYAVDRLCAYTGWPIGHVYLAEAPGASRWEPTAIWHLDAPARFVAFQQATQALGRIASNSLVGRVGTGGQPEWWSDVAANPAFQRQHAAQAAGLRTGVAWPILVGLKVAGVLEFYTTESLPPNPALLETMSQIGTQLGRTIERERAMEQAQRQQEALLQREKLAAMSTMLASVAHELNNPLASIGLQTEILQEDVRGGPLAEPVAEIAQAVVRCERLVRQFLTLARQHPPERTVVALNTLVAEAVEILAYPLRVDNVAVHLHLDAQVPPLWSDAHQLQQVLINLLTNAQHALRAAPGPREVTCTTQYDATQQQVTLTVADTGPGISPALQARIFEPFFTTKPPGVGSGLGLPLCRGIVEAHGGTLTVSSTPGQGATFRITLPLGNVPAAPPAPSSADEAPVVHDQTILVVDDEPSLASGLARLLRRDGHTVETAANGRLALARLQARAYDLILCDVRMPELDGPSLYRLLERQQPNLCQRIIFLTGDTLEPATQAFLEASGVPCLLKPFAIAEARRVIQRTLQGVAPSAPDTRPV
jgi:two-component system NtrC family sensor kinase